nr:protein decapping 5-like isoform X2 [Ipomoea batatas]
MASESGNGKAAPSSDAPADSYIGSFISLTSMSEFRYEGVLSYLNPQTSVLGLKNVRSYGTEGRKKDGPQVPASDKIYDYIMFSGSDIKDIQVKSQLEVLEEAIPHDPAIIQSQCVGDAAASSCHYAPPYPIPPMTNTHSVTCDFPMAHPAQAPVQTSSVTPSSLMPLNFTPNLASQQYLVPPPYYQPLPSPISSSCESRNTENPAVCKSGPDPIPVLPSKSLLYPMFSSVNNLVSPSLEQPPSLPTPDQLPQGRLSVLSPAVTSYPDQKDIEVMSSETLNSLHSNVAAVQAPLLPLPSVSKLQSSDFTEEFDFVAMNEKFNKDELWGYLGKAKTKDKIELHKDKALVSANMENDSVWILDADPRPAYSKDDFFDNISRNTVTRGVRNGQSRFNGRVKLDNETFGNFQQRKYPGYGGYGAGQGQNHGSFGWGRGYNYRGRERGVYM